jgi:hypothetical protein
MSYLVKLIRDKSNGRIILSEQQARVLDSYLFRDGDYLLNTKPELDSIVHELDDLVIKRQLYSVNDLISHFNRELSKKLRVPKKTRYTIPTEDLVED